MLHRLTIPSNFVFLPSAEFFHELRAENGVTSLMAILVTVKIQTDQQLTPPSGPFLIIPSIIDDSAYAFLHPLDRSVR